MVELVLFIGLFCLFFYLPVSFHIYYYKTGADDRLILEMTFLGGLLKRRKVVSLIKHTPQNVQKLQKTSGRWFFFQKTQEKEVNTPNQFNFQSLREFWLRYQNYGLGVTLLTYFLPAKYQNWLLVAQSLEKRGRFERFVWITRFGTGNIAHTAILYGLLWGLKAVTLEIVRRKFKFRRKPELQVIMDYRQSGWDTLFDCIFRVKLGYIIIVALSARFRAWVSHSGVKLKGAAKNVERGCLD